MRLFPIPSVTSHSICATKYPMQNCTKYLQRHGWFPAAQKDHIILGTDNYFKCSQTKWDQYIGERSPRTRGVPGTKPALSHLTHVTPSSCNTLAQDLMSDPGSSKLILKVVSTHCSQTSFRCSHMFANSNDCQCYAWPNCL